MRLSGLERAARPSSQGRALEPAGDRRPREMTVAPQGEQNPAYSLGVAVLQKAPLPSGASLFLDRSVRKTPFFEDKGLPIVEKLYFCDIIM